MALSVRTLHPTFVAEASPFIVIRARLPRVLAGIFMAPVLTVIADTVGIIGGRMERRGVQVIGGVGIRGEYRQGGSAAGRCARGPPGRPAP